MKHGLLCKESPRSAPYHVHEEKSAPGGRLPQAANMHSHAIARKTRPVEVVLQSGSGTTTNTTASKGPTTQNSAKDANCQTTRLSTNEGVSATSTVGYGHPSKGHTHVCNRSLVSITQNMNTTWKIRLAIRNLRAEHLKHWHCNYMYM